MIPRLPRTLGRTYRHPIPSTWKNKPSHPKPPTQDPHGTCKKLWKTPRFRLTSRLISYIMLTKKWVLKNGPTLPQRARSPRLRTPVQNASLFLRGRLSSAQFREFVVDVLLQQV